MKNRNPYSHWITREGVLILVENMTNDHLINTILMLNRNSSRGNDWYRILREEAKQRNILHIIDQLGIRH